MNGSLFFIYEDVLAYADFYACSRSFTKELRPVRYACRHNVQNSCLHRSPKRDAPVGLQGRIARRDFALRNLAGEASSQPERTGAGWTPECVHRIDASRSRSRVLSGW